MFRCFPLKFVRINGCSLQDPETQDEGRRKREREEEERSERLILPETRVPPSLLPSRVSADLLLLFPSLLLSLLILRGSLARCSSSRVSLSLIPSLASRVCVCVSLLSLRVCRLDPRCLAASCIQRVSLSQRLQRRSGGEACVDFPLPSILDPRSWMPTLLLSLPPSFLLGCGSPSLPFLLPCLATRRRRLARSFLRQLSLLLLSCFELTCENSLTTSTCESEFID